MIVDDDQVRERKKQRQQEYEESHMECELGNSFIVSTLLLPHAMHQYFTTSNSFFHHVNICFFFLLGFF